MTPSKLAHYGQALYGKNWQTDLALALNVADRSVRRWLAGDNDIPAGLDAEIRKLMVDRAKLLAKLIAEIPQ